MAKPIKQRVALEGGQAILKELTDIGEKGSKAFRDIQSAAEQVKGPGAAFGKSLRDMQTTFEKLGVGFASAGRQIRSFGYEASIVSVAAGAAVAGIGFIAKGGAEAADAMGKAAEKTGLAIEAFGELSFAAEQGDVSAESFGTSMSRLSRTMAEARDGTAAAREAFQKAGVSFSDGGGKLREVDAVVLDLAAKFEKMEDGAEKSALAMELFGRGGAALIPFLNEGRAGLERLAAEAAALGLTFTQEEAKIGDEFGDTLNSVQRGFTALKDHIGLVFAPVLTEGLNAIKQFLIDNREAIIGFFEGLRDAFIALPDGVKLAIAGFTGFLVVVGPVLVALGAFVSVLGFAFSGLGLLVGGLGQAVLFFANFGASLSGGVVTAIRTVITLMGTWGFAIAAIVVAIAALAYVVYQNWDQIRAAFNSGVAAVVGVLQTAGAGMVAVWQGIGSALVAAANAIIAPFAAVWNAIAAAAMAAWEGIKAAVSAVISGIRNGFNSVVNGLRNLWKGFVDWFEDSVLGRILAFVREIISRAAAALAAVRKARQEAQGGGGASVSAAGGGYIRGAGSGTSDSIPAWLSNGEFVVRAAAVKRYGSDLFAALNGLKIPSPSFALGGMVEAMPRLRFANGGPVAAASVASPNLATVNLFLGDDQFSLLAPQEVATALETYSISRQTRSIGRRPSAWG